MVLSHHSGNKNFQEETMSMFCHQCQETARNTGCTVRGVCGKQDDTANYQDLLVYVCKGIAIYAELGSEKGEIDMDAGLFIVQSLFITITNANFDNTRIIDQIKKGLILRDNLKKKLNLQNVTGLHDAAYWTGSSDKDFEEKSKEVGILSTANEDIRSLRSLIVYGVKGLSAYADHAAMLGFEKAEIYKSAVKALAATTKELSADQLLEIVMETGANAVTTMALLDQANTATYGNPVITSVNIGVGKNPGILVSGHDLRDMKDLLEQTEGTGIDIYTHSEMLPAHYYPELKKYKHLVGNYGNAWWKQDKEFETFNGPILMTTNCIVPVKDAYKDRIYTTGMAGYPGVPHIGDRAGGKQKDFSKIIEQAKKCPPPTQIEEGSLIGGFAHNQVFSLADKIVEAVKGGAIKRFVVMAGCDGRHKERAYFTEFAEKLPKDVVILTAGCAKYRYNKLNLGDINGIPRVLDAGQCNDSYSLAIIALKLKEIFSLDDINKLPISFDIAWYEQKAVAVLLALLSLGIKNIHLGPTLPGFLSPNVAKIIVEKFGLQQTTNADADISAILSGK